MIYQTHHINLKQLEKELKNSGLIINIGLSTWGTWIVQLDELGDPVEIDASYQPVEEAHIAMRFKTIDEYSAEFQTANNPRKQEINSIVNGLLPQEEVVDDREWPNPNRLKPTNGLT